MKMQSKSVSWSTRLATYWTQVTFSSWTTALCPVMFCQFNEIYYQHLKARKTNTARTNLLCKFCYKEFKDIS